MMATSKLNDCFALADDGLASAEQNTVIPFYILDFETSGTDHHNRYTCVHDRLQQAYIN